MTYTATDSADVVLINLPLVAIRNDPYSSIPSIPLGLVYLSTYLKEQGHSIRILDAFGMAPKNIWRYDTLHDVFGLQIEEIVNLLGVKNLLIGISVHSGMQHFLAVNLIKAIKNNFSLPVIVGGHHTTSVGEQFLSVGADAVVLGEGELPLNELIKRVKNGRNFDGVASTLTFVSDNQQGWIVETLDDLYNSKTDHFMNGNDDQIV